MDARVIQMAMRIEHQHSDGSWGEMVEGHPPHHTPADHDPERKLGFHRIFRCTSCDESVTIVPEDNLPPVDE